MGGEAGMYWKLRAAFPCVVLNNCMNQAMMSRACLCIYVR